MKTHIYVIIEDQTEGGWGSSDFEAEAFWNETDAEDRAKKLNAEKPAHCGYFYSVTTAKIVK